MKERKRARVERGAGVGLMELRNEEQLADRHAVASDEEERQHDENSMRYIHIGKRGSETANEEELDRSRYIEELLDWYREEDAGDLRRGELNEVVENMTALKALERTLWKKREKLEKVRKVTRTS